MPDTRWIDWEQNEEVDIYCEVCKVYTDTKLNPIIICDVTDCGKGYHAKCCKVGCVHIFQAERYMRTL